MTFQVVGLPPSSGVEMLIYISNSCENPFLFQCLRLDRAIAIALKVIKIGASPIISWPLAYISSTLDINRRSRCLRSTTDLHVLYGELVLLTR